MYSIVTDSWKYRNVSKRKRIWMENGLDKRTWGGREGGICRRHQNDVGDKISPIQKTSANVGKCEQRKLVEKPQPS